MNSEKKDNTLDTVDLGRSGLRVTELGFGGIPIMRLGMDEAVEVIRQLRVGFQGAKSSTTTSYSWP